MKQRLARHRSLIQYGFDVSCWMAALVAATLVRLLDPDTPSYSTGWDGYLPGGILRLLPVVLCAVALSGVLFGMYRGRWRFGSFDEVLALVVGTLLTSAIVFVGNVAISSVGLPRSVPPAAGALALVLMAGGRYLWRMMQERRHRPTGEGLKRLLVVGAGEGGIQIIRALLSNPHARYVPVAILDDDPNKRNWRVMGVPVVGTCGRLAAAAAEHRADTVLIAVPSAGSQLVTQLCEAAIGIGLPVKVLPKVNDLVEGIVGVGDIRDVSAEDLLGRHCIDTDLDSIASYLTGRRVLVTGAGGSIGSELCQQIYHFAPSELIMLDRDESALHAVYLSIYGRATMESPDLVLMDLPDRPRLERLFAARRPQVVFHAAALKHLPILERHPAEAVRTNVWATIDLLEVSVATGVERFVNVSTDKAADPTSVLGYTKRITERLSAHYSDEGPTNCLSVRFGNVLGSRGSVLATFRAQIERGGPITITDPEVTRYFMTVQEAVQLVVQAGAVGRPGEVLVLDMGEPVSIEEVARILAARAERRISFTYTGLRGGEKLHEVLLGAGEADERRAHPLISHVRTRALDPMAARAIDLDAPDDVIVQRLAVLCGESRQKDAAFADD